MSYYRYRLDNAVCVSTSIKGVVYNNEYMRLCADGSLVLKEGYAWNGVSPKCNIFDIVVIGAPDGIKDYTTGKPKLWEASLVHDALMQFRKEAGVSIKDANRVFNEKMIEAEFKSAKLYYTILRTYWWCVSLFVKEAR